MKRLGFWLLTLVFFALKFAQPVQATNGQVLGVHILHPYEISDAKKLVTPTASSTESEEWHYVTIPLTLDDLERQDEWRNFFQEAKKQRLIP
jgi:hypothetical protein